ncbi:MAG TPA: hypothetical protein VHE78_05895 [Gemmatimonadaceae bacterium]|nr:hypothetical protein [Gemmatimonadaceae bacterium]
MTGKPRPKRRAISTPGQRRDGPRRSPASIAASVAIHAAVIILVMRLVILGPRELDKLLSTETKPLPVDHIGFLALPRSDTPPAEIPRSGGDNRPIRRTPSPPAPPIVAPVTAPSAIAEPSGKPASPDRGGKGEVVGRGGATEGVRPSFSDPRVWAPPAPVVVAPLTPKQRMDSAIVSMVTTLEDSLARVPVERAPGDWTYTRNGKKYGIDGKMIHLGNFSLPTAILALLPLNASANPSATERDRRLTMIRGEIQAQAARAARDDDFHRAVKALRERKERERAEQKKAAAEQPVPLVKP